MLLACAAGAVLPRAALGSTDRGAEAGTLFSADPMIAGRAALGVVVMLFEVGPESTVGRGVVAQAFVGSVALAVVRSAPFDALVAPA